MPCLFFVIWSFQILFLFNSEIEAVSLIEADDPFYHDYEAGTEEELESTDLPKTPVDSNDKEQYGEKAAVTVNSGDQQFGETKLDEISKSDPESKTQFTGEQFDSSLPQPKIKRKDFRQFPSSALQPQWPNNVNPTNHQEKPPTALEKIFHTLKKCLDDENLEITVTNEEQPHLLHLHPYNMDLYKQQNVDYSSHSGGHHHHHHHFSDYDWPVPVYNWAVPFRSQNTDQPETLEAKYHVWRHSDSGNVKLPHENNESSNVRDSNVNGESVIKDTGSIEVQNRKSDKKTTKNAYKNLVSAIKAALKSSKSKNPKDEINVNEKVEDRNITDQEKK